MRNRLKITQAYNDKPVIRFQSLDSKVHPITLYPVISIHGLQKSSYQVCLEKQAHVFKEEKESHLQSKNHQMESQAHLQNLHLSSPQWTSCHLLQQCHLTHVPVFWAGNPCLAWSAPSSERCPEPKMLWHISYFTGDFSAPLLRVMLDVDGTTGWYQSQNARPTMPPKVVQWVTQTSVSSSLEISALQTTSRHGSQ